MRRLAIRPGAIGDVILSLPALEHLSCEHLEVWTTARCAPLVRFAARVRTIPSTGLDLVGITEPPPGLMQELQSFDSIVSWYGSNRAEFREALTGLPVVFLQALPPPECRVHATDYYLEQVGGPCGQLPLISVDGVREDYAVIHPFSGSPRKNWPVERFRAIAEKLPMPVRWCAGEDDPPLADAVRISNLLELAGFLRRASLYLGNDSGITHLAAAVNTPTLGIFLASDPAIWAPRGENVRVVQSFRRAELP